MKKMALMAAALLLSNNLALAAELPDTNQVEKAVTNVQRSDEQMRSFYEHEKLLREKKKDAQVDVAEQSMEADADGVTFEVTEVRVSNSRLLTKEEIKQALEFDGPRTMSVAKLQELVHKLNLLYQAKGFVTAQAVLPPQTIKGGVVYIRLIEGVVGEVRVDGNRSLSESYVLKRMNINGEDLVDLKALQHKLEFYNNSNISMLRAELLPGAEEGHSDIVLHVQEPRHRSYNNIWVDNAGQDSTDIYRTGYYHETYGLGKSDDRLFTNIYRTRGVLAGSVGFEAPISAQGTRLTVGYSKNRVKIIDGPLEQFNIRSFSNDLYTSLTHPLNITTNSKTELFAELHHKWAGTDYRNLPVSYKQERKANTIKLGVNTRNYDRTGLSYAQVSVTGYRAEDTNETGTENKNGAYYTLFALRRQNLGKSQYLTAKVFGQYSSFKRLPGTETFSAGGTSSVRGYEEGLLSGYKGFYSNLEYNFPLSKDTTTWRGLTFADAGLVYNSYSEEQPRHHLSSCGVGVEFSKQGWFARLILGVPVSQSEDVKHDKTRTHFYLQKSF